MSKGSHGRLTHGREVFAAVVSGNVGVIRVRANALRAQPHLLYESQDEPATKFYESIGAKPQHEWVGYRLTGKALKAFAGRAATKTMTPVPLI